MSEFLSETNKAEIQMQGTITKQVNTLRFDEIRNSIEHIQDSLDRYLEDKEEGHLRNVYWHIGAIKAAAKF